LKQGILTEQEKMEAEQETLCFPLNYGRGAGGIGCLPVKKSFR
jgi:hypothetical protein